MPSQALIEKLYAEIIVVCEAPGCHETFICSKPAGQPVEAWAARAADEAESQGWTVSLAAAILEAEVSRRRQQSATRKQALMVPSITCVDTPKARGRVHLDAPAANTCNRPAPGPV